MPSGHGRVGLDRSSLRRSRKPARSWFADSGLRGIAYRQVQPCLGLGGPARLEVGQPLFEVSVILSQPDDEGVAFLAVVADLGVEKIALDAEMLRPPAPNFSPDSARPV
jgi:hypothetical protein